MVVVLILSSIVAGLAFSVLTLVQRHMQGIQGNFNNNTELDKLDQLLWLDFNRCQNMTFQPSENRLVFLSAMDTTYYEFHDNNIIKDLDTFPIPLKNRTLYFNGETVGLGKVDALRIETTKLFQERILFVYKQNDAAAFMDSWPLD